MLGPAAQATVGVVDPLMPTNRPPNADTLLFLDKLLLRLHALALNAS